MSNKDDEYIEKQLREELDQAAPDIFDELIDEIDSRKKPDRRSWKWLRYAGALAAVLIIFVGAGAWLRNSGGPGSGTADPVAMVGLDVNPSVELFIDDTTHVVEYRSVNDDGRKIIGDMDLAGADIKVAANALVGSMLKHGYLTDASNSVFLSVVTNDSAKGKELEGELADELNGYFENAAVSAAVMGEYIEEDEEVSSFARENSISTGKAWLIKTLASGNKKMTEKSLLQLTTQELLMIWSDEDSAQEENTLRYGDVNSEGYISGQDACEAALKDAGFSYDSVSDIRAEYDCDDGRIIYEVEFTHGSAEYEYEIDAKDGTVVRKENDNSGDHEGDDEYGDDDDEEDNDDDDDDDDEDD